MTEVNRSKASITRAGISWPFIALAIWLIFTVSLAGWWLFFALSQVDRIYRLGGDTTGELLRHQKMIVWEGGTLVVSLLIGGACLAYYMLREIRQSRLINDFLLAFTHEMKTSVASVQLQAEILAEELQEVPDQPQFKRLLGDLATLGLHLENALTLASIGRANYHRQPTSLREVIAALSLRYPEIEISLGGEAVLYVDRRAFEIILANIIQNAKIHGNATALRIDIKPLVLGRIILKVSDNGSGFKGDHSLLAQRFVRHYRGSGSGVGLYLCKALAKSLRGSITFPRSKEGFSVDIELEGRT